MGGGITLTENRRLAVHHSVCAMSSVCNANKLPFLLQILRGKVGIRKCLYILIKLPTIETRGTQSVLCLDEFRISNI